MKNILLLTDFSDLSEYAKILSDKVGVNLGATLHVLKIIDVPSIVNVRSDYEIFSNEYDTKFYQLEHELSLKRMPDLIKNLESKVKFSVVYGEMLNRITSYIEDNNIELVVMGTNEISSAKEMISGSLTQQIILNNKVPVLSLKCALGDVCFTNFLVTGDFESKEEMNFDVIKGLQKVFNSKIHLLTVNTRLNLGATSDSLKKMEKFVEINNLFNVEYHIHSYETTEDGIVNFANNYDENHDLDIDLIEVEKKNTSTVKYWFTGSDAINYVNHIYRPMITYLNKN